MEFPVFNFMLIIFCAFTGHWWKKPGSTFFTPLLSRYLCILIWPLWALSRLNNPSCLLASPHTTDAPKPGSTMEPYSSMSVLYWWALNWTQHSNSPVLNREGRCPSECGVTLLLLQPGSCYTYLPEGHIASSWAAFFVQQGLQFHSCQEEKKELKL